MEGTRAATGPEDRGPLDELRRGDDASHGQGTDIEAAQAAGATDADLAEARKAQRRSQFYVDFVESENSNGFHAPQEATRILGDAIDPFRKGQVSLRPLKWSSKAAPRPPAD